MLVRAKTVDPRVRGTWHAKGSSGKIGRHVHSRAARDPFRKRSLLVGLVLGDDLRVLGQNLVVPQPLGDAVQLVEQPLARLVVIDLGGGGFLVAIEAVERL